MPVGSGKTQTAIQIAKNWVGDFPLLRDIVWITHRKELEEQSGERLSESGLGYALVTSPIRLHNLIKNGKFIPHLDSLAIFDESHHSAAKTWKRIIESWPGPVLGLTATPWRLSKREGFDKFFDELVIGPSVNDLIKLKYLVPCRVRHPNNVSKGYGWNNGDYSMGKTWNNSNKTILVEYGIEWLLQERKNDSRTLAYCTTVQHAESVLEYAIHKRY